MSLGSYPPQSPVLKTPNVLLNLILSKLHQTLGPWLNHPPLSAEDGKNKPVGGELVCIYDLARRDTEEPGKKVTRNGYQGEDFGAKTFFMTDNPRSPGKAWRVHRIFLKVRRVGDWEETYGCKSPCQSPWPGTNSKPLTSKSESNDTSSVHSAKFEFLEVKEDDPSQRLKNDNGFELMHFTIKFFRFGCSLPDVSGWDEQRVPIGAGPEENEESALSKREGMRLRRKVKRDRRGSMQDLDYPGDSESQAMSSESLLPSISKQAYRTPGYISPLSLSNTLSDLTVLSTEMMSSG